MSSALVRSVVATRRGTTGFRCQVMIKRSNDRQPVPRGVADFTGAHGNLRMRGTLLGDSVTAGSHAAVFQYAVVIKRRQYRQPGGVVVAQFAGIGG